MRSIRLRRHPEQASDTPVVPVHLLPADQRSRATDEALGRRLRAAVHPRFYAAQVGEAGLAGDVDGALAHFLEHGVHDGARVSGLFNEERYRERAAARGLSVPADVPAFLHWVTVGWDERVVPTVLFDEDYYLGRHGDLRGGREWAFAQYLRTGCYAPNRWPGPFGPNYGGPPAPDARERQDPPLVSGMLHRAEDYDLRRTSWLEEGVAAGHRKLATLDSPRTRELVAKAAAIEPLVLQPKRERWVAWPPHSHPMVVPTARVEEVRRGLGVTRADSVLLLAGGGARPGAAAETVARTLRERAPGSRTLLVGTEGPSGSDLAVPGAVHVDLSLPFDGLTPRQQLLGLLDLVRGVQPRRVVVVDSALGWELLTTFGRSLRHETVLGACVPDRELDEDGDPVGPATRALQACFDVLDWAMTDTGALRDDLVARYLLGEAAQGRLLAAGASDECEHVVLAEREGGAE